MASDTIHLGGKAYERPEKLNIDVVADWLLGDEWGENGYNRASVRLYDFADSDDLAGARHRTERDRVTFADLGRMSCLGASLRYKRAHLLMRRSRTVDWPKDLPCLEDTPANDGSSDAFVEDPGVIRAHNLFRAFKDETGLGSATVSKMLHLKWPDFYPIADVEFRNTYRARAAQIHADSSVLEGKPTSDGNIRSYWLAFRADLIRNENALELLPQMVLDRAHGAEAVAHARRLGQLGRVRLLDILAWKAGRGQ